MSNTNNPALKAAIRAAILATENTKAASQTIKFFGAELEFRHPTAGDLIAMATRAGDLNLVTFLIDYAYVPGTDEKVFTPEDADALKQLPFTAEMKAVVKLIEGFTSVMVETEEKN